MTLKTDFLQLGVSVTATNDFIFTTDSAGGLVLSRGTIVNNVATPLAEILKVSAAGDVTFVQAAPGFRASRTTAQSLTSGVAATAVFNSEESDTDGAYDNTTGIFTAPVKGLYQVNWRVGIDGNTGALLSAFSTLQKNAADRARGGQMALAAGAAVSYFGSAGSDLVLLDVGDNVRVSVQATTSTSSPQLFAGSIHNHFSAILARRMA